MIRRVGTRCGVRAAALANDDCLRKRRTGIAHYLAAIARHWPQDAEVELVGLRSPALVAEERARAHDVYPPPESLPPVPMRPLSHIEPARRWVERAPFLDQAKAAWRGWQGARAAAALRKGRCRLVFEPNCLALDCGGPVLAAMQDLSVVELPHTHPADRVRLWNRELRRAVQRTTHWISLSQATADCLIGYAGLRRSDVTVIPAASRWTQPPSSWAPATLRRRLGVPDRYLLYLGTIEPRKNLVTLLDAYAQKPAAWRARTPLILAGSPGWGSLAFWEQLRSHPVSPEVLATGYLSDVQAAALLAGARALVYPSLYEGFGLPLVEAMTFGSPIVASAIPSLTEVAGDAAILLDPADAGAWSEAIERIAEPGSDREEWVDRGRRRGANYSWPVAAERHHDLFLRYAI